MTCACTHVYKDRTKFIYNEQINVYLQILMMCSLQKQNMIIKKRMVIPMTATMRRAISVWVNLLAELSLMLAVKTCMHTHTHTCTNQSYIYRKVPFHKIYLNQPKSSALSHLGNCGKSTEECHKILLSPVRHGRQQMIKKL